MNKSPRYRVLAVFTVIAMLTQMMSPLLFNLSAKSQVVDENPVTNGPVQCVEGNAWATGMVSYIPGNDVSGNPLTDPNRTDPNKALGANDWVDGGGTGFVSTGIEGDLILSFTHPVLNVAGNDLTVYEATNGRGSYPEEKTKVSVSQDGINFSHVAVVTNASGVNGVDISSTGWNWFKYVMFRDNTDKTLFLPSMPTADGYDVDAVSATYMLCDEYPVGTQIQDLTLTSVCTDDPAVTRKWTIHNGNSEDVDVEWEIVGSAQTGSLMAGASSNVDLTTTTVAEPNTLKIKWRDGNYMWQDESLVSSGVDCTPPVTTLEICKYYDLNTNNVWDSGEQGLSNWNFTVESPAAELGVSTGATGCVTMPNLLYGKYKITEETRSDWNATGDISKEVELGATNSRVTRVVFGNEVNQPAYGNVSGFKYEDKNGNGIWEQDEPKLKDWKITAGTSGDVIADYLHVYANGTPYYSNITLENGAEYYVKVYGNYTYMPSGLPTAGIADAGFSLRPEGSYNEGPGPKWINGDDLGGFAGYLELQMNDQNINWGSLNLSHEYSKAVTGNGAKLKFNILDDNYSDNSGFLKVVIYKKGWSEMMPTDDNGNFSFSLPQGSYGFSEEMQQGWVQTQSVQNAVNVSASNPVTDLRFGNFKTGSISGYKYEDMNMDGSIDGDPVYKDGWVMNLYSNSAKSPIATATTNSNGYYEFKDLGYGTYFVCEGSISGWTMTYVSKPSGQCNGSYEILSGTNVIDVNFGNYEYGKVDVFKFEDKNGDGIKDPGENGIANWPIVYTVNAGSEVMASTGADGHVMLTNLVPGNYKVWEGTLPVTPDWYMTTPKAYYEFSIQSGSNEYAEFGNFLKTLVKGGKYNDLNGNGMKDGGEPAIEGWKIYLRQPDGTVKMEPTDINGVANFGGQIKGHYEMWEESRPGWVKSQPVASNYQFDITESGQNQVINRFGNYKYSKISGYKYVDNNYDGQYNAGDNSKGGWLIKLYKWNGNDWVKVDDDYTNGSGYYEFRNLKPGDYKVEEQTRNGWVSTGSSGYKFNVTSGSDLGGNNFMNFELGRVVGFKFEDNNGDGNWQLLQGELPKGNWDIYLYGPIDNPLMAPAVTRHDTTNLLGGYEFEGLVYGTYQVYEEMKSGWSQTRPYVLTHSPYYMLKVDESGDNVLKSIDDMYLTFGNIRNAKVSGYKYEDMNGNGKVDSEDEGLENWTVTLCPNSPMPLPAIDTLGLADQIGRPPMPGCMTVMTDVNGYYEFSSVPYGEYILSESMQNGWTQTGAPESKVIVHRSGIVLRNQNFVNFENIDVNVWKYNDKNYNGMPDKNEDGIGGWEVTIDKDGTHYSNTPTDNLGMANFINLGPGNYTISEDTDGPDGNWLQTSPYMYTGFYTHTFTAMSGEDMKFDFGNWERPSIVVNKYNDYNGNGVWDIEDTPIEGWVMTICPVDDTSKLAMNMMNCKTKETNEKGKARFNNLDHGTYRVMEEIRDGWMHTQPGQDSYYMVDTIKSGKTYSFDFGNFELGKVKGYKWEDMDQDGYWDDDEVGIEGWQMKLCKLDDMIPADKLSAVEGIDDSVTYTCSEEYYTTTNAEGYYKFNDIGPGFYAVAEENKGNWVYTYPNMIHKSDDYLVGYEVEVSSGSVYGDKKGCYGYSYDVEFNTLTAQESVVDRFMCPNFGNYEYGSIQGRKYNDVNRNGDFDQAEKDAAGDPNRLNDWGITLYMWEGIDSSLVKSVIDPVEGWVKVKEMVTGDDTTEAGKVGKGQYRFVNLDAGKYLVCEEYKGTNWVQTEPNAKKGMVNPDDLNPTLCSEVDIKSGDNKEGKQFGNYELIPDLYIDIDDGVATNSFVNPGNTIVYTIKYGNIGEYNADNVAIEKIVPVNTTYTATGSTAGWVCTPNGNAGSVCKLNIGSLAVGASGVATLAVVVDPTLTVETTIYDPAKIYYNNGTGVEITMVNNQDKDSTLVKIPAKLGAQDTTGGGTTTGEVLGASGYSLIAGLIFALLLVITTAGVRVLTLRRRKGE